MNGRNKNGTFAPGNQYGKIKRPSIKDTLEDLLMAEQSGSPLLEKLCHKLIQMGMNGSLKAIEMIFSYVDGKPRQILEVKEGRTLDTVEIL